MRNASEITTHPRRPFGSAAPGVYQIELPLLRAVEQRGSLEIQHPARDRQ
jgi:hypothetical protein